VEQQQKSNVIARCRGCGADILWFAHEKTGKVAPIDAYPDFAGNVLIDGRAGTWRVATAAEKAQRPNDLHHSHFTTCAYSEKFRSRGRK
jgi:hypothetical protein